MEVSNFHFSTESEYSEYAGCLSRSSSSLCSSFSGGSSSAREGKIALKDHNLYRCTASYLFETHDRIISMAMVSAEDDVVYVGSESGSIRMIRRGQVILGDHMRGGATVNANNAAVKALAVGGDYKLYSAHHDKKIRLWCCRPRDRGGLKLSKTLPTVKNNLKNLIALDVKVQKNGLKGHVDAITSVALNVKEDLLYSGSWDKSVKVWRLSDFECTESIEGHNDSVNAIATGEYGTLFTGSADRTVKVWRFVGWKGKFRRRSIHQLIVCLKAAAVVNSLALSGDESVLYAGTSRGGINYWMIDDKSLQICNEGALWGHGRSVLCLWCVGRFVCSGSADNTVRIWTRETGIGGTIGHSCLAVLRGHTAPVKCIAASPSCLTTSPSYSCRDNGSDDEHMNGGGLVVYTGSFDGSIKTWWVNCNGH